MAKLAKPLSDALIKKSKAKEKQYKLNDGNGLFMIVRPNGKKVFKLRYKKNGKESEKTLGEYPLISLKDARLLSNEIKKKLLSGIDPNEKSIKKNFFTFDDIADKYFSFKEKDLSDDYLKKQRSRYNYFIKPCFGSIDAELVSKKDILDAISNIPNANTRNTKNTDLRETMRIVLLLIGSILKYANANDIIKNSAFMTIDSRLVVPKRDVTHFKSVTNDEELRSIYNLFDGYVGDVSTKYALKFLAHTALRSHNVRFLKWKNIDFDNRIIEFEKDEMKSREAFRFPLTDVTYGILKEIEKFNREYEYVFSSILSKNKMLSENTLGYALKRMGITNHTPHGFRSSFSTICHEKQKLHGFSSEVIESQLAHSIGNSVKLSYLRSDFLDERRELLKWWDNFLCGCL